MSQTFFSLLLLMHTEMLDCLSPGKTFKPCLIFEVKASAFLILGYAEELC